MTQAVEVDVLRPGELGESERAAWATFNAEPDPFRSPYFSFAYALAADGIAPEARIAVLHRRGAIVGFFPFQRRWGTLQPLAAPLTDYHGVIAAGDARVDLTQVLRTLGTGAYHFSGLRATTPPAGPRVITSHTMSADVRGGMDAYLAGQPRARKFIKEKERVGRNFAREHGALTFDYDDDEAALFDFVVDRKREQYRDSGHHDIFSCGWTQAFLRRLWEERRPEFGARISTLRADGRLVAAELALYGEGVHHVWFPAYDAAFARYGPGVQLMHRLLPAIAEDDRVDRIDFGKQDAPYKAVYADAAATVFEGRILVGPIVGALSRATDATVAAASRLKPLQETRERFHRRFDVITACETRPAAWVNGAVTAFRTAALKRSSPAATP